jgi:P4 family phage/plasmid primase-like protien
MTITEQEMNQLSTATLVYWEQGFPIIAFWIDPIDGRKKPYKCDAWGQWQKSAQSREEYEKELTKIFETKMFGVVCGIKTIDGFYFYVIDRDVKDPKLTEEIKAKTLTATKDIPATRIEKTRSGGEHFLLYSEKQVDGKKFNKIGMELLGFGNLAVMAPSEGYSQALSSDCIAQVADPLELFYTILEKQDLIEKRVKTTSKAKIKFSDDIDPKKEKVIRRKALRGCFVQLMELDHLDHLQKVALIYELYYCGRTQEEIKNIFHEHMAWEPPPEHHYNEKETDDAIAYTFKAASSGEYRYKKETLQGLEICKKDCQFMKLADCRQIPEIRDQIEPIAEIAKPIEKKYKFAVEKDTELLYVYNEQEGIWTQETEHLIAMEICKILDNDTRKKYYQEVENWIKHNEKTMRVKFNPDNNLITMKNCVMNVETGEKLEAKPEYYLTTKIPHDYNPEITSMEQFTTFLDQIMPSKSQQKEIQEILGKTLARKNRIYHTVTMFIGEGNNGKSVLLDVIRAWLGNLNTSHVTIQALAYDKFEREKIKDKIANICADLPSEILKHMGMILMISAGDAVTLQKKYGDPYEYEPNISLLFSCNEAPTIDASQDHIGTYRRIVIFDFPIIFTPVTVENPKPEHPEDKLLREKLLKNKNLFSFLTNWAREGYIRLMNQGDLTDRPTVQATRLAYIKKSDSCHAFIIDKVIDTAEFDDKVFDDELYREYIAYCVAAKLTRHSKGELTKAIYKWTPGAEHTKTKIDPDNRQSERKPCWRYLKLKGVTSIAKKLTTDDKGKIDSYNQANECDDDYRNEDDDPRGKEDE